MGFFTLTIASKSTYTEILIDGGRIMPMPKSLTTEGFECSIPKSSKYQGSYFLLSQNNKLPITLLKYSLHKPVYAPCRLDMTLQVTGSVNVEACREIIVLLDKSAVDLTYTDDDKKSNPVASDYYIYQVNPRLNIQDSIKSLIVEIVAYSKDHLLTLEKGSQSFTAKKFIKEIFRGEDEKICASLNVSIDKTTHSQCLTLVTESEDKNTAPTETEVIQPYLVQYDEPYYNFLARTANRCGELMYFENGKLCIGLKDLPEKYTPIKISQFKSISFVNLSKISPLFTSIYPNTVGDKKSVGKYASELAVMDDVATDEYMFKIKKGEWKTFGQVYAASWDKKIIGLIPKILNNEGLANILADLALEESMSLIQAGINTTTINKNFDKSYFDPTRKQQRSADGSEAYPFNSYFSTEDQRTNIPLPYLTTHSFYNKILEYEHEVSTQAIEIDFGTSYQHIILGDIISLDGIKYLVTDVKAVVEIGSQTSQSYQLTAIPLYRVEVTDSSGTSSHDFAIPPLYEGGHIRKSGVQRAYIYETKDPLKLGRVRIRYPWQKDLPNLPDNPAPEEDNEEEGTEDTTKKDEKDEKSTEKDQNRASSSPWIRFSSDYTVNNGGICFQPEKNTEVLIDYENGNVEHPYVIGSLYNAKNKAYNDDSVNAITSKHGHSIRFSDPKDNGALVSGLWGGWGLLTKFLPAFKDVSKQLCKDFDSWTGGIEMRDYYGFYNISMSTDKRSIKIDSPFGTVGINAFSGITISAPNGDVKIVGKNVSILANNNLILSSGMNIKKKFDQNIFTTENKKETLKTDAKNLGEATLMAGKNKLLKPIIDLRLLRNLYESVIKPVEGTLKIKSFRYLMLEAGKGATEIPKTSYDYPNFAKGLDKLENVLTDIGEIIKRVRQKPAELLRLQDLVHTHLVALLSFLEDNAYKDIAQNVKFSRIELVDTLNNAIGTLTPQPDFGEFSSALEKRSAQHNWDILKTIIEDFNSINKKEPWIIRCTNMDLITPFWNSNPELFKNEIKNHLKNEIKDYIYKSNVLTAEFKNLPWDKFVDSLKLKGTNVLEKAMDVALGFSSLKEGAQILYPYVWSKNSSGEILMSTDKSQTIIVKDGRQSVQNNRTVESVITEIKNTLKGILI